MTDNATAVATKIDWSILSDVILDGGYELKEILDKREDAAKVRVRVLGSGGKTATAYFLHLEPADAADQLDIWNTLREAPHPNLNRPAAVGKRELAGVETVYMVLPDADERLAAVVPERPLEWEEAAEVLHSCEKGLAHLHAHGLLHGSVSPQNVEAVGYSVQLNTESVYRIGKTPRVRWQKPQYLAPESKNLNLTTAADVWCLGATLFEVLSQEPYGTAGAELEKGLPLAAVVQRCLDKNPLTRCTLKDASAGGRSATFALPSQAAPESPTAAPVQPEAPPQPRPSVNGAAAAPLAENIVPPPQSPLSAATAKQARTTSSSRLPQPLTPKEPPKQVTKEDMVLVPIGKRHKKVQKQAIGARIRTLDGSDEDPAYGEFQSTALGPAVSARITALGQQSNLIRNAAAGIGLTGILMAAVWFIVLPKLRSIEQPLTSNVALQIPSETARPESNPNVPLAPPNPLGSPSNESGNLVPGAAGTPAGSASTVPPPAPPAEPEAPKIRPYFRVVVASFATRQEAKDALDNLSVKHPELFLQVGRMKMESTGDTPQYVLAVGGVLTRSDAEPLLQRLQNKGVKVRLEHIVR